MEAQKCPSCRAELNESIKVSGANQAPDEDSWALCYHCGAVLRWSEGSWMEPVTDIPPLISQVAKSFCRFLDATKKKGFE